MMNSEKNKHDSSRGTVHSFANTITTEKIMLYIQKKINMIHQGVNSFANTITTEKIMLYI